MKNNTLFNENHSATYCMEDDKIRLYVGRVPREEFEALRAEGWTSTPKQDCDFAAVWTIDREDTALSYAGEIDDEDQSPADRAADRAERFAGYRDKRTAEAVGHADRFDAGPQCHGYQSEARAYRAADRHDRIAGRAVTQWDKAEYWVSRTAGVIDHALHVAAPGVRMGRIKTIEADLRKAEKSWREATDRRIGVFECIESIVAHAAGEREKPKAFDLVGYRYAIENVREEDGTPEDADSTAGQIYRAIIASALDDWKQGDADRALAKAARKGEREGLEIAREWLEGRTRPADWNPEEGTRYTRHLKLRIAYELQMLEAQGGRAAMVEMEVGGFIGGHQIHKINRSAATGRVVSVGLKVKTNGLNRWGRPDADEPEYRMTCTNIERLAVTSYRAPTPEEKAAFEAEKKQAKAAAPKYSGPSLVNPTLEDAKRLQAVINEQYVAGWIRQNGTPSEWRKPREAGTVCEVTQAEYSANSKGSYARAETKEICALGEIDTGHRQSAASRARKARIGPVLCKLRMTGYEPPVVIHITDKPSKALPAAIWEAFAPEVTPESLRPKAREIVEAVRAQWNGRTPEQKALIAEAVAAGLVNDDCMTVQMTERGDVWAREAGAYSAAAV